MPAEDPNRRIYGSRAVGRVSSGSDDFEKQAIDGHPAEPIGNARRMRVPERVPGEKSAFDQALERFRGGKK
ncbi:MAG TPA: hypothetical protein VK447_07335 [Myxococcaceae bacterium]|nr:hypothetical protein [Myxococcaceae bacterium]